MSLPGLMTSHFLFSLREGGAFMPQEDSILKDTFSVLSCHYVTR